MRRLVYISTRSLAFDDNAVVQACEKFAALNEATRISGILLYGELNFLQVIEGPSDEIGSLFERIKADSRHSGVVKTSDETVVERCFDSWGMRATQIFLGRREALEFVSDRVPAPLAEQLRNFASL